MKKVFKIESWHLLAAFIVLFSMVFSLGLNDLKEESKLINSDAIAEINPVELDENTSSGISCVLFYQDEEDYGKKMMGNLAKLQVATKEHLRLFRVNISKYMGQDREYDITGSPTLLIFNDGKEVARIMGVTSVRNLKSVISKL